VPNVDCWSLLGIPRGASADEIKNAYARRVRDVHPDAGGTGDGLTMSLLKAARDEALGQAGHRQPVLPESTRGYRAPKASKPGGRPCYVCGQKMPRDQLYFYRIHASFYGRPKAAKALVCAPCTHIVEADRKKQEFRNLVTGILAMIAFTLFAFFYAAIVQPR
jgi:predicted nucleic acid-binding Zn ribbon protein